MDNNDYRAECARLDAEVDKFAEQMKRKLHQKVKLGFAGWNNPPYISNITASLMARSARLFCGDLSQSVHIGNYAMMCFYHRNLRRKKMA